MVYQWIGLYQASWHPPRLERFRMSAPIVAGADGVEQDLDRHPCLAPWRQEPPRTAADLTRPVDVGLDRDRLLAPADRLEHRRIKLVAVVEHREPVALA